MRLLLAALGAAILATPAAAGPGPLLAHGTLDAAPAAYLGCVHLPPDTATSYCFVAVPEDGAVTVTTLVTTAGATPTVTRVTRDATALVAGVSGVRRTVRLRATLPDVGDVDLTSHARTSLTHDHTNDLCTPSPLHVELISPEPVLAYVDWTDGTISRQPARNLHGCASALAVGPVTGTWRMASGL